jgi:hypothetical protein
MPQPPPIHTSTPAARSAVMTDSTSSALITQQALPATIAHDARTRFWNIRVNAGRPLLDLTSAITLRSRAPISQRLEQRLKHQNLTTQCNRLIA